MRGMHFSLVKMNPEGTPPSHGFDDAILPLYYALRHLGYQAEILFNRVNPASRNIVFGSRIAPRRIGRRLPASSIIFNLEQLNRDSKWCNKDYLAHLGDFQVWDYSLENIRFLAELGIAGAAHVPIGYVPEMTRLRPGYPEDVDLVFYGLITQRRDALIRRLVSDGIRVLASQEAFGDLRDKLLAHSRLVLNIHQFLPARLEVVRLGYVWANKKPVLSEWREDSGMPDHLREACFFAEYADIPEAAARLLQDRPRLDRQAEKGFQAFASKPMSESLRRVVGKRNHAQPPAVRKESALPLRPYHARPVREWLIQAETRQGL